VTFGNTTIIYQIVYDETYRCSKGLQRWVKGMTCEMSYAVGLIITWIVEGKFLGEKVLIVTRPAFRELIKKAYLILRDSANN